ncbi:MAG: ribosome biogenesis/translation initiation ATPase RLI [archaeon]|jgi:ATP-binding cassette subfamily E protein 1
MNSKKRIAAIDYDKCNHEKCGNYLCEKLCPVNRTGKKCITYEKGEKPKISEELCIGCEICQNRCPFEAISIVNINFDLGEPTHSFGENNFRLHGLPLPKEKNVMGLVGRNGIGKTTSLKILSGEIIPNFGDEETEKEKVIMHYKGKDAQKFFKKLYSEKGFTTAVKPQNIEKIKTSGKVIDLLKKIAPEEKVRETAKKLKIEEILERDSSSLSGGEFQKIAIAATGLKEANLYFFDEPTSFLDIRERLRVAEYIRKLAEKSEVIVVEHDLILLDYLSDYIYLMYGKPGVYGFISQLKTTREGINSYLEGYSKEENYRFRGYEINFFGHGGEERKKSGETIISWPTIEKKLGNFKLKVKENSVKKNEVIGIVGPNGIGKTTLMKILAGELSPDNTSLETRVKISYKPQYLSYSGEKKVADLFENADFEKVRAELLKPLELESLLEKKAKNLSGGETQRLSIALCLNKKADIYLLDEPSAYLDIEQRLSVAKVIKTQMDVKDCSAIVIDHDLTFIDYISDKLIVFTGEPSIEGMADGPFSMREGMNKLLTYLGITVRRDKDTKRPRINKIGSVLDREQKQKGEYYYA